MVFRHTFRVRWVDTDLAGVMHYSNYLRYFEACEEEYYRSLGFTLRNTREKYGIMLPRIEAHCQYRAPCRFDDTFEVTLKIEAIGEKTITYGFQVVRKDDQRLAAEGILKCIAVDLNWRAVPLPDEFVKLIRENGA
jgi:YbgC/YbaW family acyl-CoA thioester hydrolase